MHLKKTSTRLLSLICSCVICVSSIPPTNVFASELKNTNINVEDNTEGNLKKDGITGTNESIEDNSDKISSMKVNNTDKSNSLTDKNLNNLNCDVNNKNLDNQVSANDLDVNPNQQTSNEEISSNETSSKNDLNNNSLQEKVIEKLIDNNNISIKGNLPNDLVIDAKKVTLSEDDKKNIDEFLNNNSDVNICDTFDISMLVNNNEYQPLENGKTVNVTISNIKDLNEKSILLHIKDNNVVEEIKNVVIDGSTISFVAETFSKYVVLNTTEKEVKENSIETNVDNKVISITGEIPNGATIKAEKLNSYNEVETSINNSLTTGSIIVKEAFDISIMLNGNKYQPVDDAKKVNVKISNMEIKDLNKEMFIYHIKSDGTVEQIQNPTFTSNGIEFSADSFSVYALVEATGLEDNVESSSEYKNEYAEAYLYEDGTLMVNKINEDETLELSATDYPWYADRLKIKKVVFNKNITMIRQNQFADCTNLSGSLSIPDNVKIIEANAFLNCTNLNDKLLLPFNIEYIEKDAFKTTNFKNSRNISSIVLEKTSWENLRSVIENCPNFNLNIEMKNDFIDCFLNVNNEELTILEMTAGAEKKEDYPWYAANKPNIKKVKIERGNYLIGDHVFEDWSTENSNFNFTGKLILNNEIIHIGKCAFKNCDGITSFSGLPTDTLTIGDEAFMNCSNISSSLSIPQKIEFIGDSAFENCKKLNGNINLPGNKEILDIIIPSKLTKIGNKAFKGCENISGELIIPNEITTIGDEAFYGCKNLRGKLVIGKCVTSIGEKAFEDCFYTDQKLTSNGTELIFYNEADLNIGRCFYNNSHIDAITLNNTGNITTTNETLFSKQYVSTYISGTNNKNVQEFKSKLNAWNRNTEYAYVKIYYNNGSNYTNVETPANKKLILPDTLLENGEKILGLYTNYSCTEIFDIENAIVPKGGLTLYAKTGKNMHTVKFYKDSYSLSDISNPIVYVEHGKKIKKPNDPVKNSHRNEEFFGWYYLTDVKGSQNESPDLNNPNGDPFFGFIQTGKSKIFDFDTPITEDLVLYEEWHALPFDIEFNPNNGEKPINVNAYGISRFSIPNLPEPPRNGDLGFKGWYNQNGFKAEHDINSIRKDDHYHAVWTNEKCTIHFDSDGGSTVKDFNVTPNTELSNSFLTTKDGHIFMGWFDENGVNYGIGSTILKDLNLKAKWIDVSSAKKLENELGTAYLLSNGTLVVDKMDYDEDKIKDYVYFIGGNVMTNTDVVTKYPWYSEKDNIKKVIFSQNIYKIGSYAFDRYYNLKQNIDIPKSCYQLGYCCFRDCIGFTGDLDIRNVPDIRYNGSLNGCSNLNGVAILHPKAFGMNINSKYYNLATVDCNFKEEIAHAKNDSSYAIYHSKDLVLEIKEVYADNVDSCSYPWIGFYTAGEFANTVIFDKSIKRIPSNAFSTWTGNNVNFVLGDNIEVIGERAFNDLENFYINKEESEKVKKTIFPKNLKKLEENALFSTEFKFPDLVFGENLEEIGKDSFMFSKLTSLDFTKSTKLKTIGERAFSDTYYLKTNLILPDSIEKIDEYAFCNSKITGLKLPANLVTIGGSAFVWCSELGGNLVIPDKVTHIYSGAFMGTKITGDLILPDSIELVDSSAFSSTNLNGDLVIGKNAKQIYGSAFSGSFERKSNDQKYGKIVFNNENQLECMGYFAELTNMNTIVFNCPNGIFDEETMQGVKKRLFYCSDVVPTHLEGTNEQLVLDLQKVLPNWNRQCLYHDVTFIYDDTSKKVPHPEYHTLIIPKGVVKNGYHVSGVYKDANFSEPWDLENELIKKPETLYLKIEINKYKIKFNTGCDSVVEDQTVVYNDKIKKPEKISNGYYTFDGWYLDDKKFDFNTPVKNDITLTAKWILEEHEVTFNKNNGEENVVVKVNNGEKVSIIDTPTKEGYTFDKWTLNSKEYNFEDVVLKDIELIANWKINQHSVKFDTGCDIKVPEQKIDYGKTVDEPKDVSREGYEIEGWYLNDKKFDFKTLIKKDIILTAKWKVKEYTIKFDTGCDIKIPDVKVEYGKTINKPKDIEREGHKLNDWYLGNEKFDFNTKIKDDITLVAKWNVNEYLVTFETNGGSKIDSIKVKYGEKITKPNNPTKNSYSFDNWFNDKELKVKWNFENDVVKKDITLYAKWNEDKQVIVKPENKPQEPEKVVVNEVKQPVVQEKEDITKTGDESGILIYIMLCITSLAGLAYISYKHYKVKEK